MLMLADMASQEMTVFLLLTMMLLGLEVKL